MCVDSDLLNYLPLALTVDVPEMDGQHAELFAQLEHLKERCIECNALATAEADTLHATLRHHCATEQRMAEAAGIDFSLHGQKHQQMLAAIDRMFSDVRQGRLDIFSLIRYVDYWIERHIREEDVHFARQLKVPA